MCARARLASDYSKIKTTLALEGPAPNLRPSWNIAPTDDLLVVRLDRESGRRISEKMRWGLIPAWSSVPRMLGATFNARGEGVDRTPAFRDAWRAGRRCLIVADGFYEWSKRDKQPFAIARTQGRLTLMTGLWEEWRTRDDVETIRSCTVVTTDANDLIAPLHDRMPVILAEADWPTWLGEEPATDAQLKALLRPYPADDMELWPIDHRVGNVKNNDARLLRQIEPQPELF